MSDRWQYFIGTAGNGFLDTENDEWPTGTDICNELNRLEQELSETKQQLESLRASNRHRQYGSKNDD